MLNLNQFPRVNWPRFRRVRQTLQGPRETDVAAAVRREITQVQHLITPGKTYAIGVGSRGIANIALIARTTIEEIRRSGADVIIVPAMASHGGATPDGQKEVLASFGITEAAMGAHIDARMDVAIIDHLPDGTPIYFSQAALDADGIIPINRVKLHTAFHGPIESGLTKMLVIGFGKQHGAATVHSRGFAVFDRLIPEIGRIMMERLPIVFGLAILENGYEDTALVRALPAERILAEEPQLMDRSRQWIARLPFDNIDVLVVGQIGKNISGDGMDPNVTGRYGAVGVSGGPTIGKMAVLNLTTETHGNANGLGVADSVSLHAYREIDWAKTYTNALTSTEFGPIKTPMVMPNDHDAIEVVLRTINGRSPENTRTLVIQNTLKLEELVISEALWEDAHAKGLQPQNDWAPLIFDAEGNLHDAGGLPIGQD